MNLKLKELEQSTLDIEFSDGSEIQVKTPTVQDVEEFDALCGSGKIGDVAKALSNILSNNVEQREISVEYLKNKIQVSDFKLIRKCVISWIQGIAEDPNLLSLIVQ